MAIERIEFSKTITEADVLVFAGINGDFNQIHVDDAYSAKSRFGQRIVPGMLSVGMIGAALAAFSPDAILLEQSCSFKKPVFINDTIKVTLIIDRVDKSLCYSGKSKATTVCSNQNNEVVIQGEILFEKS